MPFLPWVPLLTMATNLKATIVSGMDDVLLQGRPFGGCGIIYRKSLAEKISHLPCVSKRFCAVLLAIGNLSILCICVYFPTNYHDTQSSDAFLSMVGEIEGFIDTISFDHLIIGGDFNVDLRSSSTRSTLLSDFIQERNLVCVDQLPLSSIKFTYLCEASGASSWIDHFVCDADLASVISSVSALQYGSNLSDHLPISATLNLICSPSTMPESASHSSTCHHTNWDLVTEEHIEVFRTLLASTLPELPDEVVSCADPFCESHLGAITDFQQSFLDCIRAASIEALPSISPVHSRRLPGWNDGARGLKCEANFWHKIWLEAGSPAAGVLAELKKKAKSRYKYEVRKLKRRAKFIKREKLAAAFVGHNKKNFWKEVKRVRGKPHSAKHPVIDGTTKVSDISEVFRNKLAGTLNMYAEHPFDPATLELTEDEARGCSISPEVVQDAMENLKKGKRDDSDLDSSHFRFAAPVLVDQLAKFFTVMLRHGFLPHNLIDCVLVPVPKPGKNPAMSESYRPIALATSLSKILEWCILIQFAPHFNSSNLQFGFKKDMSTTMCTGVLKHVIAKYIQSESSVYACFLDASKAFDLVRHDILFELLLSRGLPPLVVRLLHSWYSTQNLRVRWDGALSQPLAVSNGVRQGGVLSPILFSLYLDELLLRLSSSNVGCYWGHHFAGALAYADDVVLLAPCASALRIMLTICESFASSCGLCFNPLKTQLIRFHLFDKGSVIDKFIFCGLVLQVVTSVIHLGNKLTYNLSDDDDVLLKTRHLSRAANSLFATFGNIGPIPLTYLFRSHCLSLYGCELWKLSCPSLRTLEVTFNKCLRRIWSLPARTHTGIIHSCAGLESMYNVVFVRSYNYMKRAIHSRNQLVRAVFLESCSLAFSTVGLNNLYGTKYRKAYSESDKVCANVLRGFLSVGGLRFDVESRRSETEQMLYTIATA